MKRVEFRNWDLPEKYDPDYKLFLHLPPPTFQLLPPLSTHLEEQKPAFGSNWIDYKGDKLKTFPLIEVRRTGKKRFSVCLVKSPGGIILTRLDNKKTRAEAEKVLNDFMG